MAQFYSDPARASCPHALPDAEVWYSEGEIDPETGEKTDAGWFYQFCFPGCTPDSDPYGPFATEQAAIEDCRENFAE